MNLPVALSEGWGQSAGKRGFRDIQPVCKPGPDFDSCRRNQLIGTGGMLGIITVFVGITGFVVWFVVTDQWFALGEKIRSLRDGRKRWLTEKHITYLPVQAGGYSHAAPHKEYKTHCSQPIEYNDLDVIISQLT